MINFEKLERGSLSRIESIVRQYQRVESDRWLSASNHLNLAKVVTIVLILILGMIACFLLATSYYKFVQEIEPQEFKRRVLVNAQSAATLLLFAYFILTILCTWIVNRVASHMDRQMDRYEIERETALNEYIKEINKQKFK